MDRDSVNWWGPMPALVTPFAGDGGIDAAALEENIERLLDAGATGILAGGCTGEFWALSTQERGELFRLCAGYAAGRATVIAGTGAVTAAETIQLTAAAE
ncbi:MAG: dihydrodipicolinate synthase family protein, partial [Gammaproteobacteria bacterium]|nr:dihydrodipicolinate synthase family protein [Gammaproteobacteria bacterium]